MKNKILVLGPQLSGKSSLISLLRSSTDLAISEMDEEILIRSGNKWPEHHAYKDHVLVPEILNDILEKDNIIFFASYIPFDSIQQFKSHGFKMIELEISLKEIRKRNEVRMLTGAKDAMPWIPGEVEQAQYLDDVHAFDARVNAEQPIERVAADLLRHMQ